MNVISLFSGAGGLDLGLEAAGFKTRLCIENDENCRRTLQLNRPLWNATDVHGGDILEFDAEEILELSSLSHGSLDIVAGGPPCQSFSNLGKRHGVHDDRGQLVSAYARLVRDLKPRFFLFENVQGILQHPLALESLNSHLGDLYQISTRLLDAADYGVPQRRKRVIVLGCLGRAPVFPIPTHGDPNQLLFGREPWVTLGEALAIIPPDRLARPDNLHMKHSDEMQYRMSMVSVGKNFRDLPPEMLPNCWRNGKHQGADTFGRLDLGKPSVTIRTSGFNPTKGRYIHPVENRGLSTAEMAAIQTFPAAYRFVGTIGSIGRQIGNAVPPLLAEKFGRSIAGQIRSLKRIKTPSVFEVNLSA